ncbi:MAG TPA: hypothetical protein QGF95_08005 [Candidatus Latescibacteria bacterium]|jgi:hypothetical protein|nr:hypothetical protein [Candidatus Latescibacterota bacterium]HJP30483.1 hypothetical protein [Candidatus Latescibacterota bacterium]|tara:strand:+ start:566 stop:709 length:144 start_codon:yes stop_codon:yes gene_type:complete
MDVAGWKSVWSLVFTISSIMFYLTVTIVAYKGVGDVAKMIREMMSGR